MPNRLLVTMKLYYKIEEQILILKPVFIKEQIIWNNV